MANQANFIDRVRERERWLVQDSREQVGRYRVWSPRHQVLADGLTRFVAERLAAGFNQVADDACLLAEWVECPGATLSQRVRVRTGAPPLIP